MNRVQAIRDSIRDEYEQRISEQEGTNKMKAVEFQIQMKTSRLSAKELLQQVDPAAPIPQALEGGDMQGPLYQCILDASKIFLLKDRVEEGECILYTRPIQMYIEESKYRPDWYVQWRMGSSPEVTATR